MNDKTHITSSKVVDIHASRKEWDEVLCPICMEHPHNAVLLVCSSRDKGCRCYVCDTSYRHSNCLDRFKKLKADSKDGSPLPSPFHQNSRDEGFSGHGAVSPTFRSSILNRRNSDVNHGVLSGASSSHFPRLSEGNSSDKSGRWHGSLKCPLCRGTVNGWIVVQEARQYLDLKSRACSREACSFSGNYRQLRMHARRVHPSTRPGDVDPSRRQAWHRFESRQEHIDVLSAIRTTMPGAVVIGDYVIDSDDVPPHYYEGDQDWDSLFLLRMMGRPARSREGSRNSSRAWGVHRRSARRSRWGDNLSSLHGNNANNSSSPDDYDDDIVVPPRNRRRLTRSRTQERHR